MKQFYFLILLFISFNLLSQDLKKLDAYYAKALKDWNVPGMSIAIVKDGKIIFAKGYGTKEMGKTNLPDENTIYAIASNSKAFTSAIVGQLVDEGKLSWDDKIKKHLTYFEMSDPWVTNEATLRDALSHRIGLTTFGGDLLWYRSNLNAKEIIAHLKYLKPSYSFRAGYGYSNLMYIATGELIEQVTGKTWAENVQSRFFNPLGMTRSIVGTKGVSKMENVATPHLYVDNAHKPMPWEDWSHVAATGGILSSVKDISQWMMFQMNHCIWKNDTLISKSSHNMMWTPHNAFVVDHMSTTKTGDFSTYGLGWGLSEYNGKFRVSHTGGYSGMVSAVAMLPDEHLGVVILTNGIRSVFAPLVNYTFDQFIKAPARDWSKEYLDRNRAAIDTRIADRMKARVQNTSPSLPQEKYAGEYYTPAYGNITVDSKDGKMKIAFEHSPDLTATLEHWHYDTWKLNWDNPQVIAWFTFGTVKFNADNNGMVTGISFDVPNDDFWFTELDAVKK